MEFHKKLEDGTVEVTLSGPAKVAILSDLSARQAHYADQLSNNAMVVVQTRAICSIISINGIAIRVTDEISLGTALDLLGSSRNRDRITGAFASCFAEEVDEGK